jgi:predicted ATPase
MKIDKVYIKNFRSIEEIHISLKDISIFIGDKGTGKMGNVLDLLV